MPLLVDLVVALVEDDFLVVEGGGVVFGFDDDVDLTGVVLGVIDLVVAEFRVDEGCGVDESFADVDDNDGVGSPIASTQYELPTTTSQDAVIDGF
jgi:hypothetical protein